MSLQQRLMLATLKGTIDGKVAVAKALVRAAFRNRSLGRGGYEGGYLAAHKAKSVEHLKDTRDIQRTIHEYLKGVGYHV